MINPEHGCPPLADWPSHGILANTADLLSAMAHPTRLAVLLALTKEPHLSAGALQDLTGAEQTALSHQLRVLREASLVQVQRNGRQMIYALTDAHIAHIVEDAVSHAAETALPAVD